MKENRWVPELQRLGDLAVDLRDVVAAAVEIRFDFDQERSVLHALEMLECQSRKVSGVIARVHRMPQVIVELHALRSSGTHHRDCKEHRSREEAAQQDYLTRVSIATQFTSHVLPPSSENA